MIFKAMESWLTPGLFLMMVNLPSTGPSRSCMGIIGGLGWARLAVTSLTEPLGPMFTRRDHSSLFASGTSVFLPVMIKLFTQFFPYFTPPISVSQDQRSVWVGASNLYPPSRVSENQPKLQPAQHQDKRSVWGGVISPSRALSPHPTPKMMVNHHPVLVRYHGSLCCEVCVEKL